MKRIKIIGVLILVFVMVFMTSFVSATDEPKIHWYNCSNGCGQVGSEDPNYVLSERDCPYKCESSTTSAMANRDITTEEQTIGLPTTQTITFRYGTIEHTIIIDEVTSDSATLTIDDKISATLRVGQSKDFDLDSDEINDIKITLNKIVNGRADINIEKLAMAIAEAKKECIYPSACKLADQNDSCGELICPTNYGFCYSEGVKYNINDTNVYCLGGILIKQKENNIECQNNFECVSNFCSNGKCFDISKQVQENTSMINRILNWFKRIFRF